MPGTFFAPADRATAPHLRELAAEALQSPVLTSILQAVNGFAFILDYHRQIIGANDGALDALGVPSLDCLLGMRPGEALHCIHAGDGPGGCGTSKACRTCGAILTLLQSNHQRRTVNGDCAITIERDGEPVTVNYRVRVTPHLLGGEPVSIAVLQDVTAEKEHEVLHRVYTRDFENLLASITHESDAILRGRDPKHAARNIHALASRLRHELAFQHALITAEHGHLDVVYSPVQIARLCAGLADMFRPEEALQGKTLQVMPAAPGDTITTDETLLTRILINMLTNAFDAIPAGQSVSLWFERHGDTGRFCVQNPGVIPEPIALRMFERGNTTKTGEGLGLGAYSIRLFAEGYLHGKAGFHTAPETGTRFWVDLPMVPPDAK